MVSFMMLHLNYNFVLCVPYYKRGGREVQDFHQNMDEGDGNYTCRAKKRAPETGARWKRDTQPTSTREVMV